MIISNQAYCKVCGDAPFSAGRNDLQYCYCENLAVDGGTEYLKRIGDEDHYNEMAITLPESTVEELIEIIDNPGTRTSLGVLCALMRTLRDAGELK